MFCGHQVIIQILLPAQVIRSDWREFDINSSLAVSILVHLVNVNMKFGHFFHKGVDGDYEVLCLFCFFLIKIMQSLVDLLSGFLMKLFIGNSAPLVPDII